MMNEKYELENNIKMIQNIRYKDNELHSNEKYELKSNIKEVLIKIFKSDIKI